jgi:soluble lytic murein transglycosylase-like protein
MRRSGTIALALVCGALLFGGAPDPRATEAEPVSAGASAAAFGEDQVVEQLRRVNSTLTERQLRRIAAAVIKYSAKYRLSPELVTAVMRVESTARPWARSPKGAVGLMQVMPHMAEPVDFAGNLTTVESNVEAGCMILSDNIRRLGEEDGISAYFWGSEIRGMSYLQRVRAARAAMRRSTES